MNREYQPSAERRLVNTRVSRREATGRIVSACLGSIAPLKIAEPRSSREALWKQTFQSVRSRIQKAIARGEATGVAVAVTQGGNIVWEEGFGWANRETAKKATAHTPFSMASITKPFTATTIMTLVAQGTLSLDERANRYLGQSKLLGANRKADEVSVRLLGAHASGLPGIYESYEANEATLVPTPDALLRNYGRLAYPAALCYEYSNIGYAALDAIASAATNTGFASLMRQNVLAPLGLKDSFFGNDPSRLSGAATRYDPLGRAIPHYVTSTPASGELYASAHDLARFALFNMRHLQGEVAVLSDAQIDELHRTVFTGPSGVATTFGWFKTHTASGTPALFKSGGDPGVANRIYLVPSKDFACIAVTNQSNSWQLAYEVCDELTTSILPDWKRPEEYCGFPASPFVATPAFRGRWEGSLDNDGANMRVELRIDSDNAASLSLGTSRAEAIREMRAEGEAFTGTSTGRIDSPEVRRTGEKTLQIKLIPRGDELLGRVFAVAGDPNFKNVRLPYVLTLKRSHMSSS